MAAVSAQKMSDSKLAAATGRVRAEWHAVLDAAGAREWKHPQIAAWLQSEHEVDGWWAQGITVGYEQAIGRRLPGQTADGTFAGSVTKTFAGKRADNVSSMLAALENRLGEPTTVAPDSPWSTARWSEGNVATVAAIAESAHGKTVVSLTRSRIVDGDSLGAEKDRLRAILSTLAASGPPR
jgi:hypothetical protein